MYFVASVSTHVIIPLIDHNGVNRQPRFGYIPLLGILLANLFSNSIAKYASLGSLRLSYDPVPWQKPLQQHHHHDSHPYWHAVSNPFGPPSPPDGNDPQHIHHHHLVQPSSQQQIVNINERPPSEIIIEGDEDTEPPGEGTALPIIIEDRQYTPVSTSIEKPKHKEFLIPESRSLSEILPVALNNTIIEGRKIVRRSTSRYNSKVRKNNKYIYQKRRTTTPQYYDSYEDPVTRRNRPKIRNRSTRRPVNSYEDRESNSYDDTYSDDYDYPSYELITRPKRRRTTTTQRPKRLKTKNKNRNRKRQKVVSLDEYDDDEYDYDTELPLTQSAVVRQRQEETTLSTTITNGTTVTGTESTTATPANNTTNTTGYGYGPSNGHENISITYAPPTGEGDHPGYYNPPQSVYGPPSPSYGPPPSASYGVPSASYGSPKPGYSPGNGYYQVPFSDWYSSEVNKNSIVKKVNDIIGFDNAF